MHIHVCMLTSMLYIHVSLCRSRLCHTLCPLWVYACVVTSIPPRVYLDVTTYEIRLCGVGVLALHLPLLRVMLICLPFLLYATHLAFFTSMLPCCKLAYMFMHEFMFHPYFNPMELWTLDPNLHLSS